jgi:uncharacterized protein (TIGR02453 family)
MEKTSGGGFYLQVGTKGVMVAAGVYMPEREQLLALRRWMSANHEAYRAGVKKLLKARGAGFEGIDAQELTRMPKGFAKDDPADELVRATNWGVHAWMPAELATEPELLREIVRRMKMSAPLVEMLNGAILKGGNESAGERTLLSKRPIF